MNLRRTAASGGDREGAASAAVQLVGSPLYRVWLQLGVVLVIFMLIDAAYSGDWSRIGVISKEQEQQLQQARRQGCAAGNCTPGPNLLC